MSVRLAACEGASSGRVGEVCWSDGGVTEWEEDVEGNYRSRAVDMGIAMAAHVV